MSPHHSRKFQLLVDHSSPRLSAPRHGHRLDQQIQSSSSAEEHRPDQPGESRNMVVPTTGQRCRHHPEGGNHDGHSPQPSSEELRRHSTDPSPHSGHLDDQLTSSHSASEAKAQSPSTTPSFASFDDSRSVFAHSVYTMSDSLSVFFSFRIAQTRLMLLSIIHGLNPNCKLKAILERCANLNHLWGSTLESHQLFSQDFFLPNCVYLRFTHINNFQPKFYIGSAFHHV